MSGKEMLQLSPEAHYAQTEARLAQVRGLVSLQYERTNRVREQTMFNYVAATAERDIAGMRAFPHVYDQRRAQSAIETQDQILRESTAGTMSDGVRGVLQRSVVQVRGAILRTGELPAQPGSHPTADYNAQDPVRLANELNGLTFCLQTYAQPKAR